MTDDDDNKKHVVVVHKQEAPSHIASLCCWFRHKWHPTHALVEVDGEHYEFNSRAHRKMRFLTALSSRNAAVRHPIHGTGFRLWCWEPHIISWHICWIGVIANSLWVVNGVYAVWGDVVSPNDEWTATLVLIVTGIIGAFLFIVTAYLGVVEAINHTHGDLQVPPPTDNSINKNYRKRQFKRPQIHYGRWGHAFHPHHHEDHQEELLGYGFPLIQDVQTKKMVTYDTFQALMEQQQPQQQQQRAIHEYDIRIGDHIVRVRPVSWRKLETTTTRRKVMSNKQSSNHAVTNASLEDLAPPVEQQRQHGYRWWTWEPDLRHMGVFNALLFLVCTIVFFLPACLWYPMEKRNAPIPGQVFWVYVLQIIPSIGFIYVGWAGMAEVSGSWFRLAMDKIGWWIGLFNMIGGWGFLLYPVLALPNFLHPTEYLVLLKWGAAFATFWGSCFFWLAGILQCMEFGSQHPIIMPSRKQEVKTMEYIKQSTRRSNDVSNDESPHDLLADEQHEQEAAPPKSSSAATDEQPQVLGELVYKSQEPMVQAVQEIDC